jgi:hypothetical protein
MSNVVRMKIPKRRTIKAEARSAMTDAFGGAGKSLSAVVVVALGTDGTYALRTVHNEGGFVLFDIYSRAAALIERRRMALLDSD